MLLVAVFAGSTFIRNAAAVDADRGVGPVKAQSEGQAIVLGPGPHLFLDDYLIAEMTGLTFAVHSPAKYAHNPVIPAKNKFTSLDKTTAPTTVLPDLANDGLRMWYIPHSRSGGGYHLGYATSKDGIQWKFPDLGVVDFQGSKHNNLVVSHVIGGRVLFAPHARSKAETYKAVFYRHRPEPVGFSVAFSPDGLRWGPLVWIKELDDSGKRLGTGASDVVNAFYDPVRREYVSVFKMWSVEGDYTIPVKRGVPPPRCGRRILGLSRSKDFRRWSQARVILKPDAKDPATLEFYGMPCVIRRGDLFIGFLPCLIDDAPPDGIGWTELAVSRDGDHWQRIRRPFLPRSKETKGAKDHAIAWISEVVRVGDREHVYYNGLEYGHKSGGRFGCLALLRSDGFASLGAGQGGGTLLTKPVSLRTGVTGVIALNADAQGGTIRVQLRDGSRVLAGYAYADCDPITVDSVSIPVRWRGKSELPKTGRPFQIQFSIKNARLFGFSF